MIALTYEQKLAAYEWTIKALKRHPGGPYMSKCLLTYMFGNVVHNISDFPDLFQQFPELVISRPYPVDTYEGRMKIWFTGEDSTERKILALERAIQILNDERDLL